MELLFYDANLSVDEDEREKCRGKHVCISVSIDRKLVEIKLIIHH